MWDAQARAVERVTLYNLSGDDFSEKVIPIVFYDRAWESYSYKIHSSSEQISTNQLHSVLFEKSHDVCSPNGYALPTRTKQFHHFSNHNTSVFWKISIFKVINEIMKPNWTIDNGDFFSKYETKAISLTTYKSFYYRIELSDWIVRISFVIFFEKSTLPILTSLSPFCSSILEARWI